MLDSKKRSYLTKLANDINPIFQVGKASLTTELISAVEQALDKRELIKISVLKNCLDDPREIADTIAGRTKSEVVRVIGKKIILYKQNKKKPKIEF